ncbi:MAG: hypothetical protein MJ146_03115 [Clostridia bacterium]|nr:hypothetical protein [Clostridia bacterium]
MKNRLVKNQSLLVVAKEEGVSYKEVLAKAQYVKEKYGISFYNFAKKGFFTATEEEIKKQAGRIDSFNIRSYQKLADALDVDVEDAKAKAKEDCKRLGISFRKYYFNRLYLLSQEEQQEKVDQWEEEHNMVVKAAMEETGWSEKEVEDHMKKCDVLWGIDTLHYYAFKAWRYDDEKLSTYVTHPLSKKIRNMYSNKETKFLSNKVSFDKKFSQFTRRKFWVNRDTSFEEFESFLEGVDEVFAKPIDSSMSRGAMKLKVTDDHKAMYEMFMAKEKLLVEECVKQHHLINAINDSCVNTIRVISILKEDKCYVPFTLIKLGVGGIADNLVRGGFACAIDPETGVIMADGVNNKGEVFEKHPISGVKLKGYKIPNWDILLDTVDKALRVLPGVNYVGWDVAITEDGVKIIEGNTTPDLGLCQITMAPDAIGLMPKFEQFIK